VIDISKFKNEDCINNFLKGKLYLRKPNTNLVFIVNEMLYVKYEDVISEKIQLENKQNISEGVDLKI